MSNKKRKKQETESVDKRDTEFVVNFKYESKYGTKYTEVISAFLIELSKVYGYTIDEYSLIPFVWDVRVDRLSNLINQQPTSNIVMREFMRIAKQAAEVQLEARQARQEYIEVLNALMPTNPE